MARRRAATYWITGWALSLFAMALFIAFFPHWLYTWRLSWSPGNHVRLAYDLVTLNDTLMQLPVVVWVWSHLPESTEDFIFGFLRTPPVCTAVAFAYIGIRFRKSSGRLHRAIDDYRGPLVVGPRQFVGNVYAGGKVNIHQVINEKPADKPLVLASNAAVITLLANLIGALIRHFFG